MDQTVLLSESQSLRERKHLGTTSTLSTMPTATRDQVKKGNKIVARAIRHNLVPEFKKNTDLKNQTTNTRWALHVLAVMSKEGKPDIADVKRVIGETKHILE